MSDGSLDPTEVLSVARRATGSEASELGTFGIEPLRGAGLNAAVVRVTGTLHDGDTTVPFSVVRKAIRGGDAELRSWAREPDAYASGLLSNLDGIDAPALFGRDDDSDGGGAVLWLEDVTSDFGTWTLDRFEAVANALGRFAAPYAGGTRSVPSDAWLSRAWLEGWVSMAESAVEEMAGGIKDPLLAGLYPPDVAAGILRLWADRDRILRAIRRAPVVVGHLDASPANILVTADRVVLLDWAFTGHAAVGEDLGCLVGASTLFGRPPTSPSDLAAITSVAMHGYLDGLASGGFHPDPEIVRFVFAASAALRYAVAPTAFMVKGVGVDGPPAHGIGIRDPEQRALQEGMLGRPFAELLDVTAATTRYLVLELGLNALSLLPIVERRLARG